MFAIDRNIAKDVIWNGLGKVADRPVGLVDQVLLERGAGILTTIRPRPRPCSRRPATTARRSACCRCPMAKPGSAGRDAVKQNLQDVGINVDMVATDVPGWNQKYVGVGLRHRLHITSISTAIRALGVARNYVSSQITKGSPFNNSRRLFQPRSRSAVRRRRGRLSRREAREEIYNKVAEDPGRGRTGCLACWNCSSPPSPAAT